MYIQMSIILTSQYIYLIIYIYVGIPDEAPICRNFDKRTVVYFRLNKGNLFNDDYK